MRVPTTPAHLFFLRKKIPASHRARVGTSTVSLAQGANREVKERVKGKASRVQSTRIGSALVCVRRNVQHRELKLSKSPRFALVTVVMVAVLTGCVVSPPPLFSQDMQSHEKSPTSHRAQGVPPTVSLALGANRKGKGRVKGKASRIMCVCVFFPFVLDVSRSTLCTTVTVSRSAEQAINRLDPKERSVTLPEPSLPWACNTVIDYCNIVVLLYCTRR